MKRAILILLLAAACLATDSQDARSRGYSRRGRGRGGYGGGIGTPQSAYLHGMADVIRSEGVYNNLTARGMISVEQARSQYIDNLGKWTQVYNQRRQMAESARARELEAAREQHARYVQREHSGLPPQLTRSQLDPATGRLAWPAALKRGTFAQDRQGIESLLALRARTGNHGNLSDKIYHAARGMQDDLRAEIHDLPTHDYITAHRFLDSLAYEGRYPSQ